VGLTSEQMPRTILSLSESNKVQKLYLAGAYGQGGSSTLAVSKATLIASRYGAHPKVGFTVVRFLDLPPDQYKIGHYVYLTLGGMVLEAEVPADAFPTGTLVKALGYDLSSYPSPLGPNSVYGLLNQTLIDPVMPVWLDDGVQKYRRVIKGSRNALNGAVDEGDEGRGPRLSHNVRLFYVALGELAGSASSIGCSSGRRRTTSVPRPPLSTPTICGSTPLQGGRMRAIFEGDADAKVGAEGKIRVQLTRPGLPVLADERPFRLVATPPEKPKPRRLSLPPFEVRPVNGPEDSRWTDLARLSRFGGCRRVK